MSLQQWADNGWLRPHEPTRSEIADLLGIVDRDLRDAAGDISADWRFGIAYNAALKLCTILLHASGFRAEKALQHYRTLAALPGILGQEWRSDADYLEICRIKRNAAEYEMAGVATAQDAAELIAFVKRLRVAVLDWLGSYHPELRPQARTMQ
ncbi:MAG: hypothetical protein FJY75_14360 [Candidatus Eisenbacteria bacterium]|uniref:SAV-6107-like HEPN domain-containing protein n=1 Tax=Eiseniibacteriota bacterium TaxID=2212470 RepID=A0A937XB83_UNCEI|nr:hypothetical protein [Candidatus Eisenbacteria bacterium]